MSKLHIPIQVVLVDREDVVLGYKEKYEAHKTPVPLHRAVSVVIYNGKSRKMLLQKRSGSKPTWPGYWSNATCTHPLPEETYQHAAERRLFEEMGIKTPLCEMVRIIL
jgi:isopentenyl-diphosphate Delta-isomerase